MRRLATLPPPEKNKRFKVIFIVVEIVLVILLVGAFCYYRKQKESAEAQIRTIQEEQQEKKQQRASMIDECVETVQAAMEQYLPGIVCWGDSLTAGAGGDGTTYPLVLEDQIRSNILDAYDIKSLAKATYKQSMELDFSVVNMGVGGENTVTISGRNGAIPFVTAADFTIPADTSETELELISSNGKSVAPLRQGSRGMGYVVINGVKGVIRIEQESYTSSHYTYYFSRETAGETVDVKAGTEIVTEGSETNLNYIPVVFIGQNGGYDDIEDLIRQQQAIIEHQKGNPVNSDGSARFIIIGLHTGTAESRAELEAAMEAEYGEQYINLREYMSTQAMSDAGLTPTEEDESMMAVGSTPQSLLTDSVHFTATGYELIGKLIYERMTELGYFEEVKTAIDEGMQSLDN